MTELNQSIFSEVAEIAINISWLFRPTLRAALSSSLLSRHFTVQLYNLGQSLQNI